MERRKYLGRSYKDFYKSFVSVISRVDEPGLTGYAARIQINEVSRPFIVGEKGNEICLADNGYSEISFQPDNQNWKVSAMYDNLGDIIEWYFDITRINTIDEEGRPYCDDLFLDAALMPNGQILIFDEDELQNALTSGNISQNEFDMAYRVLNELIDHKLLDVAYMNSLFSKLEALFV